MASRDDYEVRIGNVRWGKPTAAALLAAKATGSKVLVRHVGSGGIIWVEMAVEEAVASMDRRTMRALTVKTPNGGHLAINPSTILDCVRTRSEDPHRR